MSQNIWYFLAPWRMVAKKLFNFFADEINIGKYIIAPLEEKLKLVESESPAMDKEHRNFFLSTGLPNVVRTLLDKRYLFERYY
jgi:hypothetical protein